MLPCAAPCCERCALPLGSPAGLESSAPTLCRRCATDPEMPRVRAYAQFVGDTLPALLIRCKYGGERHLGRPLGHLVWLAAARQLSLVDYDAVIAVPLHDTRLLQRGFNQAVLLARPLCRHSGLPLVSPLRRVEATAKQSLLGARERGRNLVGSFRIAAGMGAVVKGRRLLLVDDVVTTGHTVRECARVLRAAGAVRVDVVCLARTPRVGDGQLDRDRSPLSEQGAYNP